MNLSRKVLKNLLLIKTSQVPLAGTMQGLATSDLILKSDLKPQQNNSSTDFQQLFNDDFNLEELRNGISTLVKGKSAGPDGILPELLINLGDSAKMTLLAFIN
ncbi:hypothetical protein TNCT_376831 [Trichonephila clavata]|uniref:Uncharacterized protein n=1 Tax=Trichonephila clavata TaxID=2740835 RepID=A0A8X6M194_TRICU|nr:hypothetical protein TNCT_376831 [Trichonephila clavata]